MTNFSNTFWPYKHCAKNVPFQCYTYLLFKTDCHVAKSAALYLDISISLKINLENLFYDFTNSVNSPIMCRPFSKPSHYHIDFIGVVLPKQILPCTKVIFATLLFANKYDNVVWKKVSFLLALHFIQNCKNFE